VIFQSAVERVLVNDAAASDINNVGSRVHGTELTRADQGRRFSHERHREDDEVRVG
jgi:hypothetical protein